MTDWTDHILKTKIKWNHTRWWMTTKRILYNNIVVIKICTRTLLLNKYISAYGNFPYRNPTKSTQTKTLTPESWSVHPVTDAAAAILSMTLAKSSGVTKPGRSSEQKANCKGANLRNRWNFWRNRGPKTWIPGKENHGLSPLTDRGLLFSPSKSPQKINCANLQMGAAF